MHRIRHVFFDLDRTLWDFETNSKATLQELYAEFGLKEKLGVEDEVFIREYKRINELFWNDYRHGVVRKEELRYARFEVALKYFNHTDPHLAATIGELYITRAPRRTGLIHGAIELLEHLRPNYLLHIITNGFEEVQHIKMESSGLSPYFQHIITSESAGVRKPDPLIFQHAESLTGARPNESIMIGDHFEADVTGALNSNWKAVYFEPNEPKQQDAAYIHIHRLEELKSIL